MEAPEVTVGKVTVTLTRPGATAALALCRSEEDRDRDGQEVGFVLGAAALALCWPTNKAWPAPVRPERWYAGIRIERYGQQVLDDLVEAGGHHWEDLAPAMSAAHAWAMESRILRSEVDDTGNFSGPQQGE